MALRIEKLRREHRVEGFDCGKEPLNRFLIRFALQSQLSNSALAAAEIAGLRAFAVHAKDEEARAFYEHFDFIASPSDPMHLFVLLKDVRALIGR